MPFQLFQLQIQVTFGVLSHFKLFSLIIFWFLAFMHLTSGNICEITNNKCKQSWQFYYVMVLLCSSWWSVCYLIAIEVIPHSWISSNEQVVSPFPPSDKIGIKSVQREVEEIVPMKQMKMDWVPYIPLENRFFFLFLNSFFPGWFPLSKCWQFFHCIYLQGVSSWKTKKLSNFHLEL